MNKDQDRGYPADSPMSAYPEHQYNYPEVILNSALNPTERIILASYYTLILTLCWVGNSFVLYATRRYRAIKLDKLSVWIIQNLCVADLFHGLVHVLPATAALISGYHLQPFCRVLMTVRYVFVDANSFLINALVLNKLVRCRFPFSTPPTPRVRYSITITAVLAGCIYTVVTLCKALTADKVRFIENILGCGAVSKITVDSIVALDLVMTCLVLVVPAACLLLFNALLLVMAWCKGKSLIKKRNFLIIIVTTLVYTVAQLPYLYWCFELYGITSTGLTGLVLVKYTRFTFIILQTSCFANPVIYYLTNKGFRKFSHWFCRRFVCGLEKGPCRPMAPSPVILHRTSTQEGRVPRLNSCPPRVRGLRNRSMDSGKAFYVGNVIYNEGVGEAEMRPNSSC